MATTVLKSFSGFEFEPDIVSDTARDGITAFQFKIIGGFDFLNKLFQPDEIIVGVPDQPPGNFRVVRRSLEHIAGDPETGLYRLSVSGEGGTGNSNLYITESSYAMQTQQTQGLVQTQTAQTFVQYSVIYLYPSVTITTNSQTESTKEAEARAASLVKDMAVSIIKDRPTNVKGPAAKGNPALDLVYVTGSSIEKAGGLYRVKATASKGIIIAE